MEKLSHTNYLYVTDCLYWYGLGIAWPEDNHNGLSLKAEGYYQDHATTSNH